MKFTRDAIFERLAAAYTGPGSTAEGSFAGDVLRACADALAELYSVEIDGLARRAFVSSATGEWLTAVCADRGIERREGEDDNALRVRALERLAALPASGNAEHYQAWCGDVEGILRVKVLALARGAGTVDIIAVGLDGRAAAAASVAAAQSIVDAQRPVGADARVFAAGERTVALAAGVKLLDGGDLATVKTQYVAAMADYCRAIALRTDTVSYAQAVRLLLDCDGVADAVGLTMEGGGASVTLGEREIPIVTATSITLTEVSGA